MRHLPLLLALVPTPALALTYGPTPYLSAADSPFKSTPFSYFHLLNFEPAQPAVPGVTITGGTVIGPGGLTDSVDADDGAIDGSGVMGRSLFGSGGVGISFTFDPASFGGSLPTHVGIVWTDGATSNFVTLSAFDAGDALVATLAAHNIGDSNFLNATAEDRFFGASHPAGIRRIHITSSGEPGSSGSGLEVDHLQFGLASPTNLPGDTNDDGVVDLVDLNNVLNNFGDTGPSPGDDNNDGVVDLEDLNRVLNNFGDTASTSALSAIPEPSALACLFAGLPLLTRRRLRP